jgi:hypothetical protein
MQSGIKVLLEEAAGRPENAREERKTLRLQYLAHAVLPFERQKAPDPRDKDGKQHLNIP